MGYVDVIKDKREIRNLIENDRKWLRFGLIDENPSPLIWDKPIRVIYKESDGRFMECTAVYVSTGTQRRFKALDGRAQGLFLSNVVAFREEIIDTIGE